MSASEIAQLQKFVSDNDPEAFRAIFMAHKDLVFTVARRILNDSGEAEDVAQECFIELARKAPGLKPPLAGWLHHLAVQRSINVARNKAARQTREQHFAVSQEPTEQAWEKISPKVDEALDCLPENVRVPLVMHFLEGKSQAEIAKTLKVDQTTISRRIKNGISDLRTRLDDALPLVLLETVLLKNGVQAAPPTLTAALGKLALSGVARTAVATSAKAGLLGVSLMNAKIILVAIISGLMAVALTLAVQSRNNQSPAIGPVSPPGVPAAPVPSGPLANVALNEKENKPVSATPTEPQWQILSSKFSHIHYSAEYEKDAHDCEKYIAEAAIAIVKEFSNQEPEKFWSEIELEIFLYPGTAEKARPGKTWLDSSIVNGKQIATLNILTTSSPDNQGTDLVGEPYTSESYAKETFFSEIAWVVLSQITYKKPGGWRFYQSPDWLHNGLTHYLGVSLATDHGRTFVRQQYLESVRAHPERISPALRVENKYREGSVLMRYILETYGAEKITKLLQSAEPTFWRAAETEMHLTQSKLYADFYVWLTGNPPPAPESKDF